MGFNNFGGPSNGGGGGGGPIRNSYMSSNNRSAPYPTSGIIILTVEKKNKHKRI